MIFNNQQLFKHILDKQKQLELVPSNIVIANWAKHLIEFLFPEQATKLFVSVEAMQVQFDGLAAELTAILNATTACYNCNNEAKVTAFFENVPALYALLNTDIQALLEGDPAALTEFEVIRTYPGFYAVSFYRIAHALLKLHIPLLPRILTEYAHSVTGIDIHPAAQIGEYLHIDHGTGIVIGETVVIGKHVKIYQGVTLGALSVEKQLAGTKRHPTVGNNVVIYSGATILGGQTIIGNNCIIGGNVWLTHSVADYTKVYHESGTKIISV
ncbi:MAG: serine acetyltransferase [Sphingobacteriales bacterium]|nr:MAG: serine acetyltransferase [Sphingobacteriales bacterium]TAF80507.1 MAG: serine acetyltransferase [Sphingobacteriales bacterium]